MQHCQDAGHGFAGTTSHNGELMHWKGEYYATAEKGSICKLQLSGTCHARFSRTHEPCVQCRWGMPRQRQW